MKKTTGFRRIESPAGPVTLEVPLLENKSVDRAIRRIDIAWVLSSPSGRARGRGHRMLFDGLVESGAVLPVSGRKVETKIDAIGWLLEMIACAWDEKYVPDDVRIEDQRRSSA